MTNIIEREKAKRRIIALLNKTTDKGASENEAMLAAEKAGELMAFYDIEAGELEFNERNIVKLIVKHKNYGRGPMLNSVPSGIAKLCQCRLWRSGNYEYTFFGFKHDVEIAGAMYTYLEECAVRELNEYKAEVIANNLYSDTNKKSVFTAYLKGFANRVYYRLCDMAKERETVVAKSTGKHLVPRKEVEIEKEMKGLNLRLRSSYSSYRIRSGSAYNDGQEAGNRVSLNKTVNQGNSIKAIG